jgi:membrane protease subunit HflC
VKQQRILVVLVLIALVLIVATASIYTVDEREKAVIVRFGKVVRIDDAAGLNVKIPFVDNVHYFDSRILTLDTAPQRIVTQENKPAFVDAFLKWRITDPLKFYVSVGSEQAARSRLEQLVDSGLRNEFGKRTLQDAISKDWNAVMDTVREASDKEARNYGIQLVDVRIQRVDLPPDLAQNVYKRMEAERAGVAKELRAEGAEAAEKIRADADRQREVVLAEAYRDSQRVRGEGDARAASVYAKAYGTQPEFAAFYRSLNAYKESFKDKSDIMVVDPSADFFKYLKRPHP